MTELVITTCEHRVRAPDYPVRMIRSLMATLAIGPLAPVAVASEASTAGAVGAALTAFSGFFEQPATVAGSENGCSGDLGPSTVAYRLDRDWLEHHS